jgi:transcriptional regulator with XRE-family HTH domain
MEHEVSEPSTPTALGATRIPIRELVRDARKAKKLTQAELSDAIGISRSHMNRLETGAAEIPRHLIELLGQELGLPELLQRHEEQERAPHRETLRDNVVDRLVGLPDLQSLTVVVADDLDVYSRIFDWRDGQPKVRARTIDVVFPTGQREQELFHGTPIHRHVEYQIKRLTALQHGGLEGLRLYESDTVIASAVLARSRAHTECAYWAPLSALARVEGGGLPVTLRTDPSTIAQLEGYAHEMTAGTGRIRVNQALCTVGPAGVRFTRYVEAGEEHEDIGDDEGVAVALVLVVGLCPRGQYGVARRIIAYRRQRAREDRERLSLFSNQVTDADVRAARAMDEHLPVDPERSRRGALAATLDTNAYIAGNGGAIPGLAYQVAAVREMRMFDLDLPADRLRRIELPPEMRLIRKEVDSRDPRPPVAPALFVLELDDSGTAPELDRLSSIADVEEIGTTDLEQEDDRLNDFLRRARDAGFLMPLLRELGVVAR